LVFLIFSAARVLSTAYRLQSTMVSAPDMAENTAKRILSYRIYRFNIALAQTDFASRRTRQPS